MSLSGKTILITGAAGGLGAALTQHCAEQGADLVLLDKNCKGLGELSDRIVDQGLPAPGLYPMDLAGAGPDDFLSLAGTLQSEFGGLHALVHCALDFDGLQPFEQISPPDWLRCMQVNVNAPWLLSCACLPLLRNAERGRLFFLLDDLELVADAYWGAYGTAKAALSGMVRQFEASLSNTEVIVRGVNPGPMRTAFRAKVYHAENPLDQPEPEIAAAKISSMLAVATPNLDLIVNLTAQSAEIL